MGVLACTRNGCNNVLCDIYIPNVGYICYSCKEEFKHFVKMNNYTINNYNDIVSDLKVFIETEKNSYQDYNKDQLIDEFFNKHIN